MLSHLLAAVHGCTVRTPHGAAQATSCPPFRAAPWTGQPHLRQVLVILCLRCTCMADPVASMSLTSMRMPASLGGSICLAQHPKEENLQLTA